jgi:hypothetical protein
MAIAGSRAAFRLGRLATEVTANRQAKRPLIDRNRNKLEEHAAPGVTYPRPHIRFASIAHMIE